MTDVEKMQPSSEAQADPTPDAQTDGAVTPGFATQDAQEDWRSLCGTQGRGMKP